MVKRGRLRTLLQVERQTAYDDGFGDGATDEWSVIRSERFSLTGHGGREYEQAAQQNSEITHVGRCRWFDGATSDLRLSDGDGRVFHVASVVNEDERNRWLVWMLKQTNG